MTITLTELPTISPGDVEMVAIDYTRHLDSGELLTGAVLATEQTTTDLTISNKAVSTAALTINGRSVAIGAAAQFSVTGQVVGRTYSVLVTVGTNSTPARTIKRIVRFQCV